MAETIAKFPELFGNSGVEIQVVGFRLMRSKHPFARQFNVELLAQFGIQFRGNMAWEEFIQNTPLFLDRAVDHDVFTLGRPFLGAKAVAHGRIDVFGLHQAKRLGVTKIVFRPAKANIAHGLDGHGVGVYIDPAHAAQ